MIRAKLQRVLYRIAGWMGEAVLPLVPGRAQSIAKERFTLVNRGRRNLIDGVIRAGLARRALREGNSDLLASYHRRFWEGEHGREYHDRRRSEFVPEFPEIIEDLERLLRIHKGFKTLCEIGTGSGQLLDYLGGRLTTVERFIGIDLNPGTIEDNRKRYTDPRLEFIAAEAGGWIRAHGGSNWILFSHRGVLEYFPQEKLETLFGFVACRMKPAVFIVIEPIGIDHDFEKEPDSRVYGREFSFSHNYPALFRKTGFEVIRFECSLFPDYRLCALIAEIGLAESVFSVQSSGFRRPAGSTG